MILKTFFNTVIKTPEKSSKCSFRDLIFQNISNRRMKCSVCDIGTTNRVFICCNELLAPLLQIYPTDQSVSSYSSNPSTPVSSPPPLAPGPASGGNWPPHPHPASPHFPPDHRTLHMVSTAQVCLVSSHSADLLSPSRDNLPVKTLNTGPTEPVVREDTHSYQQVNCLALYNHAVFNRI